MHFGPSQVLVALDVRFREGISAADVESAIERIEQAIRTRYSSVKHIFLEARSVLGRKAADTQQRHGYRVPIE
jgi:hypothetical protein